MRRVYEDDNFLLTIIFVGWHVGYMRDGRHGTGWWASTGTDGVKGNRVYT